MKKHFLLIFSIFCTTALYAADAEKKSPEISNKEKQQKLNAKFVQAADKGDIKLAQSLLAAKANIDAIVGYTALENAACNADTEMIKFLLNNKAYKGHHTLSGFLPLHYYEADQRKKNPRWKSDEISKLLAY